MQVKNTKHGLSAAIFLFVLLFITDSSSAQDERLLPFVAKRSAERCTDVPRKVLAFYYTWYGRPERHGRWVHWSDVDTKKHEIATSTHFPALGAYDSHDREIIDCHIDQAMKNGIDGFICTWWGQGRFDDKALDIVLERADRKGFAITVYWETAPGTSGAKIDRAVDDLLYILRKYGGRPSFLKVNGKPVIFVYGRVMGQLSLGDWQKIITRTGQKHPGGFLLIADGLNSCNARLFDGIHTYNICGWVQGKKEAELKQLSKGSFENAVRIAKARGKISCITVIPGYDDTKIRDPGIDAKRRDGETYRTLWEQAIRAQPDWVLITSWNEWHEGSEIEPSYEHGDLYLELTSKYAARFKNASNGQAAHGESAPAIEPERIAALRANLKETPVAVLPDFQGEAVFRLAEWGVPLRELSWQQVADRDLFTAEKFPIVVYACGERYTQSAVEEGDVDRALTRFLKDGGLLVALSSGPFPFFYNEKGRVVCSAQKLGFPILGAGGGAGTGKLLVGGWENPPPGRELRFEIDCDTLDSLPGALPFPGTGDLRWRPCTSHTVVDEDHYLPLARLVDEDGNIYGDGIAYIEHNVSEPRGGKNLYAWMRMMDSEKGDAVLLSLFEFAAKKAR